MTLVLEAADAWLPARMEAVEERLRATGRGPRRGPRRRRRARRWPPEESACARCWSCSAPGRGAGEAGDPRRDRDRARPHGDPGPRRRARRGAASPRPPDRGGALRARPRAGGRRPAVLARLRRARPRTAAEQQVELLSRASVALALGELAQRRDAFDGSISARALPGALRAEDGAPVRVRLPDRAAGRLGADAAAEPTPLRRFEVFGREIGLAFQLLDDVLDVTGPPERTGKARGTDLLDGTVTLPLILARERDQRLAELSLRGLDAEGAEAVCDRIAATGRPRRGQGRRPQARGACQAGPGALGARPRAAPAPRAGRRRRRRALLLGAEVFGEDVVRAQGGDEALDLVLHVRPGEDVRDRRAPTRCPARAPRRGGRRRPGCSCRRRSTRTRGSGAPPASGGCWPAPSRSGRPAPSCTRGRCGGRRAAARVVVARRVSKMLGSSPLSRAVRLRCPLAVCLSATSGALSAEDPRSFRYGTPGAVRDAPASRVGPAPRGGNRLAADGPQRPHHQGGDRGRADRLRSVRRGDGAAVERRRARRPPLPGLPQRALPVHRRAPADGGPHRAGRDRGRRAVHPPPGRVRARPDAGARAAARRHRRAARGQELAWAAWAC